MRRIYMDANATTPLLPEVLEAMQPYWIDHFANASSIHQPGQEARRAVDGAREQVAEFLGCRPAEVVFNSGGTEGDNTALRGMLRPGDHLVTTAIEHSAILTTARFLESSGVTVTRVAPLPDGRIDPEAIRMALCPRTRLISVMMANNETGVVQPVEAIGRIAAEAGVPLHLDAVQASGKVPIRVEEIGCQLLSISAHKMHGPKGVGALFVRRGTQIESLVLGGGHERRRRAGTENVPGIVGFGQAAAIAAKTLADGAMERLSLLRDRLEEGLLQRISGCGVNGRLTPHGASALRVANTTNLWFDAVDSEALVIALDLKGLSVSGGSACHSGATEPSHVLLAMGVETARARASLRLSLLKSATDADVDAVLEIVPTAVERLRALSPALAGVCA
jgi:cysteine desulfurase